MSYYNIPGSALPSWFTTFVSQAVTSQLQLGLSGAQVTALQAQLTALNAAFAAKASAVDASKAATVTKDQKIAETMAIISGYANTWQANPALPPALIASLGLIVHDDSRSAKPVFVPTDLVVVPNTTGTNQLKWKRNGNEQGIKFDIDVSYDTPGSWSAVTTVTAASYKHTGQTPGQTAYYRVRARNGNNVSDWSVSGSTFANEAPQLSVAA